MVWKPSCNQSPEWQNADCQVNFILRILSALLLFCNKTSPNNWIINLPQIPQEKESLDWSSRGLQCSPQPSLSFSVRGHLKSFLSHSFSVETRLEMSNLLFSSAGVPSPQTMRGSIRPCACFAGPCCALRAPAVSASWMGKMWELAPPTPLPVVLEWGCSSGA